MPSMPFSMSTYGLNDARLLGSMEAEALENVRSNGQIQEHQVECVEDAVDCE